MPSLLFALDRLSYEYQPGKKALADVTLQIMPGERLVLLGPNGCGKSTLQKLLSGLLFATGGSLQVFGREINERTMGDKAFAAVFRQKVGFVFQNSDVQMFCSSVLDEIMFGPLAMGMTASQARQRAAELMELIGIDGLAGRLPHHLSGGEKKKVMIAAILATNPEVLLFDEPTNGLDPRTQRWMIQLLKQLQRQGKTLITATHCLELVPELADRVIVINEQHRLAADGKAIDILRDKKLLLAANVIDERYHIHAHGTDAAVHIHQEER